jgi:hypothetical protein
MHEDHQGIQDEPSENIAVYQTFFCLGSRWSQVQILSPRPKPNPQLSAADFFQPMDQGWPPIFTSIPQPR